MDDPLDGLGLVQGHEFDPLGQAGGLDARALAGHVERFHTEGTSRTSDGGASVLACCTVHYVGVCRCVRELILVRV